MDQTAALGLVVAAALGMVATLMILRRDRHRAEATATPVDSPFGVSTEGEKRCPKCGMGNMWTDSRCISCGSPLSG